MKTHTMEFTGEQLSVIEGSLQETIEQAKHLRTMYTYNSELKTVLTKQIQLSNQILNKITAIITESLFSNEETE